MKTLTPETVDYLIVHASATPADMDIGVEEIDRWHRQRGWLGIGYHFVIRRDGTIEHGRPGTKPGAHVRGYNDCSWGICLIGGTEDDAKTPENNFTEDQFDSLEHLLIVLMGVAPEAEVRGHRDFPDVSKACPCFDVAEYFPNLV